MQAVVLNETGGVEVMKLVNDHPLPKRSPGQVQEGNAGCSVHASDLGRPTALSQIQTAWMVA